MTVPMILLSQPAPAAYRLGAGDVLGVYVEGVLDETTPIPNVRVPERTRRSPERGDLPSALGYPVDVRQDGTVALPQIKPLSVTGLTVDEAHEAVRKAYVQSKVLQPGRDRIYVSLLHKRLYNVMVFRRDLPGQAFDQVSATRVGLFGSGAELIAKGSTGAGFQIALPAYENDVLHALALTGGFPGTNAARSIVIFRYANRAPQGPPEAKLGVPVAHEVLAAGPRQSSSPLGFEQAEQLPVPAPVSNPTIIQIPLHSRHGEPIGVSQEDVILQEGDIIFVEAAPLETFYTGGLLPAGEHILPRDYDLDVVQAVTRVRGPLVNGAFGGSNLSGALINPGVGNPSPRLLTVIRRTPFGGHVPIVVDLHRALLDPRERILVQAGDVLILQETRLQAFVRYFTQQYNFTSIFRVFNRSDAVGTMALSVP